MKILLVVVVSLVALIVVAGGIAYGVGASLPVNHSVSVEGTVQASPARVFGLITDVAAAPKWRKAPPETRCA